ncbi:hypothetical protein MKK68_26420, partial [Methylobacterium sp. E-016]|nr:hypothetical protein [Methylobacterium sp. E-016]
EQIEPATARARQPVRAGGRGRRLDGRLAQPDRTGADLVVEPRLALRPAGGDDAALTEEAVKRAAAGKARSDTTQRTIEEITARVEEATQTFQQIIASTNQQQLGIEQVMGALQNIRQASQQTAAGTREVEAASANLTELAGALMALA